MKKKIIFIGILFIFCISFFLYPEQSFAIEQNVKVTLPKFPVNLNGHVVDNQNREYPMLVYKDMTYFPMTWYDCRLLGLETEWTQEYGLKIFQSKVTSSYVPYKTAHKNSNSYNATIPRFNITVNGRLVDNTKEEYPLLSLNNVTYFPLTWKFAHDDFGWEYLWDNAEGLAINSNNPQVKIVNLPEYAGKNDVAIFEGYYYFTETVDTTNKVYRVPENNVSNKEQIYSYELNTMYGLNNRLEFKIRNNQLWFSYHLGGATMGQDVYCKVNDDGKATVEHSGYLDFRNTPKGTLIIRQFVPPGGNNLVFVTSGQGLEDGRRIGDPKLIYGWHIVVEGTGQGYGPNDSTTIIGDDVYVLASSYPLENGDLNRIYKVNLNTNETIKIMDIEIRDFKIINSKLYYVKDADKYLYSSSLDGTNKQRLSDNQVADYNGWYGEVNGNEYYTTSTADGQLNLYKVDIPGEDKLVLKDPLESVQISNDRIICKLVAGEDYGVKIFDESGDQILAVTDQVSDIFPYKDILLIISSDDNSLKIVE